MLTLGRSDEQWATVLAVVITSATKPPTAIIVNTNRGSLMLRYLRNVVLATIAAIVLGFMFGCVMSLSLAHARDYGQWDNADPAIRQWYRSLMRPDVPLSPCCGEADAYWADSFEVEGDHYVVTITDDRDDAPLNRPHIPVGTRVSVPNDKIKWDQGNPTGHGVLFISIQGWIYCFVPGGGV